MRTLTLSASTIRQLRDTLLAVDDQERFAFLYVGDEGDLLGHRVVPVDDEEMTEQSKTACRPAPDVERTHIAQCYEEQLAPILVHSHPFSSDPRFSAIDVESMGQFREWLSGLFPEKSFGFAVLGTTGIEAVGNKGDRLEALPIEVIGNWKLDTPLPNTGDRFTPTTSEDGDTRSEREAQSLSDGIGSRHDRTVRALGEDGQRRLQNASVGIVGVGGLGSLVAEQLARLGIEDLVIIDPDIVEVSNLSRLAGAYDHHVGVPKVNAVREHLWKVGCDELSVETVQSQIEDCTEVVENCDIVVGCVDSVAARSFCNEFAVKQLMYYIDAGVRVDTGDSSKKAGEANTTDDQIVEMTGYVHLVAPGSNACFDCLGRHDQEASRIDRMSDDELEASRNRGYVDDDDLAPEPAVIHLNGLCASKTVSILVDLVTGGASPPDFIRYEDHNHEMNALTTTPSTACPTCGDDGVLGVGRRSFGKERFTPEESPAVSD